MSSIVTIKVDFQKDVWNWIGAISKKYSYGVDWIRRIPENLLPRIINQAQEVVEKEVRAFLEEKYVVEKDNLATYAEGLQKIVDKNANRVFAKLTQITEKPIYRKSFAGFITTFPRGPYNTTEGHIWIIYNKKYEWQITALIHELFHMQFEYYYKSGLLKILDIEQFNFLKESMTVIINDEFKEIITEQDKGYLIHQKFRQYLTELWGQRKDFSQFAHEAAKQVSNFQKEFPA